MPNKKLIVALVFLILLWLSIICYIFYNTSKQTKMINMIGKTKEEVREYALKYNLNLKFKNDYSNDIDRGLVMRQNIYVNTILSEGDTLVITMSLGEVNKKAYYEHKVNELGKIPIIMYHGTSNVKDTAYHNGNVTKDGYERTLEAFENDLEFYYQNDYRMISLKDYVGGRIDVELGKSPIVLTFDDGMENTFKVKEIDEKGNIVIDPKCAVAILENYKKKYPDYNVTATFFLNKELFHQKYSNKMIRWLVNNGYDIANHTYDHFDLSTLNCTQVSMEVGRMYDEFSKITNDYVKMVALPEGKPNETNHNNFKCILRSSYNNKTYDTVATFKNSGGLSYSPFDTKYNTNIISRIKAFDNNGVDDIEYYLKKSKDNRYVSDGDISTIVVPNEYKKNVSNEYELEIDNY